MRKRESKQRLPRAARTGVEKYTELILRHSATTIKAIAKQVSDQTKQPSGKRVHEKDTHVES